MTFDDIYVTFLGYHYNYNNKKVNKSFLLVVTVAMVMVAMVIVVAMVMVAMVMIALVIV